VRSFVLAVAFCGGCSGGATFDGGCQAVLGTGALAFVPIEGAHQRVPIITGPQGGNHIWASVRLRDLAPDGVVKATFTLTRDDGALVNIVHTILDQGTPLSEAERDAPDGRALSGGPDAWIESLGSLAYLPPWCAEPSGPCTSGRADTTGSSQRWVTAPCALNGRSVTMSVQITDGDECGCSDQRTFVATYDRWSYMCIPDIDGAGPSQPTM
jgi:hypothetical protein